MKTHLKKFETLAGFQSAQATLDKPNVSLIEATNGLGYLPAPKTITVTISAVKWTTFCCNRALDFTNTGVRALIVTGSEGKSSMIKVPVTKVPANTGLLLNAEQGTYSIPVTAEETDDVSTNKLIPVLTGSVTVNEGTNGNVNYVLTVHNGQVVFAWIKDNSATVTAGKAYLTLLNGPTLMPTDSEE
jgi:hypothetical protein